MKKIWRLSIALVFALAASAGAADQQLSFALSRTAASLPVLRMAETNALGDDVSIVFDVWTAPEQLLAMAQKGGHQYYVLPLTLAARLYAKSIPLQITNVSAWDGIALVSADPDIHGWSDLQGRQIHVPQQSSPPDALLRYFLDHAGVKENAVLRIHSTIPEIAQLLRIGRIQTAVLMEPQTTAALSDPVRVVADFGEEWQRINGTALPSLGFGAMAGFLRDNPGLAERFETEYAAAVAWVVSHPADAGALAEKYLSLPAALVERALPRMGLRYVPAAEAEKDVTALLRVLYAFSPELVGGRIPDAAFYHR